jgi:hypothetical protein
MRAQDASFQTHAGSHYCGLNGLPLCFITAGHSKFPDAKTDSAICLPPVDKPFSHSLTSSTPLSPQPPQKRDKKFGRPQLPFRAKRAVIRHGWSLWTLHKPHQPHRSPPVSHFALQSNPKPVIASHLLDKLSLDFGGRSNTMIGPTDKR